MTAENTTTTTTNDPNAPQERTEAEKAEESKLKASIKLTAIWLIGLTVVNGALGLGALIYSLVRFQQRWQSNFDNIFDRNPWNSDPYSDYIHYPSFGIGIWNSLLTLLAAILAICGTNNGPDFFQKGRLISHMVFGCIAALMEMLAFGAGVAIAATYRTSYKSDMAYHGMVITLSILSIVKAVLLVTSVVKTYSLLPNCCSDCQDFGNSGMFYPAYSGYQPQNAMMMTQQPVYVQQPYGQPMAGQPMMMGQPFMGQPGMMPPPMTNPVAYPQGVQAPPPTVPGQSYPTQQYTAYATSAPPPPTETKTEPPPSYQ